MKILKVLIVSFIFASAFSNSAIAQTEKTQTANSNKIAKIDTDLFNDKAHGIKELVKAEDSYSIEYFAPLLLSKRISNLKEEIDYSLSQNKSINEKYLELQKITAELNRLN